MSGSRGGGKDLLYRKKAIIKVEGVLDKKSKPQKTKAKINRWDYI